VPSAKHQQRLTRGKGRGGSQRPLKLVKSPLIPAPANNHAAARWIQPASRKGQQRLPALARGQHGRGLLQPCLESRTASRRPRPTRAIQMPPPAVGPGLPPLQQTSARILLLMAQVPARRRAPHNGAGCRPIAAGFESPGPATAPAPNNRNCLVPARRPRRGRHAMDHHGPLDAEAEQGVGHSFKQSSRATTEPGPRHKPIDQCDLQQIEHRSAPPQAPAQRSQPNQPMPSRREQER